MYQSPEYNNKTKYNFFLGTVFEIPVEVLKNATKILQPSPDQSTPCIMLLLAEEQDPNWVKIACEKQLLDVIACKMSKTFHIIKQRMLRQKYSCPTSWFLIQNKCYRWITDLNSSIYIDPCHEIKGTSANFTLDMSHKFKFFLESVSLFSKILPFYTKAGADILSKFDSFPGIPDEIVLLSTKVLNVTDILNQQLNYFCERPAELNALACTITQFACDNRDCILDQYVCDGVTDCPDDSDEEICYCWVNDVLMTDSLFCRHNCSTAEQCMCSEFYDQCDSGGCISYRLICDGYSDCFDSSDENCHGIVNHDISSNDNHICASGEIIKSIFVNDFTPDCSDFSDEYKYLSSFRNTNFSSIPTETCVKPGEAPCSPGIDICFPRTGQNLC